MNSGKQLISNTFYLFLNYFVATVVSILFWLILGKLLIPEEYGTVTTAANFIYLMAGLVGLGLAQAVSKLISEHEKNVKTYFKYNFTWLTIANVILILFLLLFSKPIYSTLKFGFNILLLCCLGIVAMSYSTYFSSVLLGLQRMKKFFTTNSISQVAKIVISIILIVLNFSFFGALAGIVSSLVIVTILQIDLSMFKDGTSPDKSGKSKLMSYSLSSLVVGMFLLFFSNIQYIILTSFKNPDLTGKFSVAMLMTIPIPVITNVISSSLFPIASRLSKIKDDKKMTYLLSLCFRYSLVLISPILFWLIPFSQYAVLIFSSEKFLEAAPLFPILAFGAAFYGFANLFSSTLYASGRPKLNRNIVVTSSIIFLILSLSLTYYYSSLGLSLAYLFGTLIYFIFSLIFVVKYIRFRFNFKSISKIILSSIISFLLLYLFKPLVHGFYAFLLLVPAVFVYLFLLYVLRFYTREDMSIIKYFSEKSPNFIKNLLTRISKLIEKRV